MNTTKNIYLAAPLFSEAEQDFNRKLETALKDLGFDVFVPQEDSNDFDAIDLLNHTCLKAGLPQDAWLTGAQMYWFEGQIFKEVEPRGDIEEEKFNSCCK